MRPGTPRAGPSQADATPGFLGLAAFAFKPGDLDKRLAMVLTVLLASLAYKSSISSFMLVQQKTSLLDSYVITSYTLTTNRKRAARTRRARASTHKCTQRTGAQTYTPSPPRPSPPPATHRGLLPPPAAP